MVGRQRRDPARSELQPGDRVRLSELGELRNPRKTSRVGTVLAHKAYKSGPASILIMFDGMKQSCRMHRSYVERLDPVADG
jgi:hypothetical protein